MSFNDKIILVTGASRGIGAATARAFGKAGAHVILSARTVGGLEEVHDDITQKGGTATILPLDLNEGDQIDTLGPHLYERFGHLDLFLANAGMLGTLGPLAHTDSKEWEKVMRVNLTANFRLIRTLDPLLRRAEEAQALFITSGVTQMKDPAYWGGYMVSKSGLEALVHVYAAECAQSNIRVNLFDPGIVETRMYRQAFPGGDDEDLADPEEVASKIITACARSDHANGEKLAA